MLTLSDFFVNIKFVTDDTGGVLCSLVTRFSNKLCTQLHCGNNLQS